METILEKLNKIADNTDNPFNLRKLEGENNYGCVDHEGYAIECDVVKGYSAIRNFSTELMSVVSRGDDYVSLEKTNMRLAINNSMISFESELKLTYEDGREFFYGEITKQIPELSRIHNQLNHILDVCLLYMEMLKPDFEVN